MDSDVVLTLAGLIFFVVFFFGVSAAIINMNPMNTRSRFGRRRKARYWGEVIQIALEDPHTRAAIYDAMEEERMHREGREEKTEQKRS